MQTWKFWPYDWICRFSFSKTELLAKNIKFLQIVFTCRALFGLTSAGSAAHDMINIHPDRVYYLEGYYYKRMSMSGSPTRTVRRHGRWYMTLVSRSRLAVLRQFSYGISSTYIHTYINIYIHSWLSSIFSHSHCAFYPCSKELNIEEVSWPIEGNFTMQVPSW